MHSPGYSVRSVGNVRAASLRVARLRVASFQDHIILKSELPAGDTSDTFITC